MIFSGFKRVVFLNMELEQALYSSWLLHFKECYMLDLTQVLTYSAALGIAAAIPGPGMAALVARSVSGGGL
ncbi:hypothetical protein Pgy4_06252, partial [Pseudomonas savastanoi pv. glycinea str. race 4]